MAHFNPYTGNYGLQPDPRPLVPPGPNYGDKTPAPPVPRRDWKNIYGEAINDADITATDDQRIDWNDFGVGAFSALDELLMGIPTWLVKGVGGGEAYKNLQNWRQQNKLASDIGQTLGFAGGMLIPGGAVVKGAGKALGVGSKLLGAGKWASKLGKGAETLGALSTVLSKGKLAGKALSAAEKAGEVAKATDILSKGGALSKLLAGSGLGGRVARGAAEAAESAIPWAITDTRQSEDPTERALGALGSIATGGLIGGLARGKGAKAPEGARSLTGNILGRTAEQAGEALDRAQLGAMGFTTQSLKKYARSKWGKVAPGAIVSQMDDVVRDVAEKSQKYGLTSEPKWKRFYEATIGDYKKIGDEMEKAGYKVGDLIGDVSSKSDDIATYLAKHGEEGAKELKELERRLLSEKNTAGALEELNKTDKWWNVENRAKADLADITDEYRDAIRAPMDEIAGGMGIDPNELRERYALTRFAQPMLAKEGTAISKVAGGSPTMEKALIGAAIGGGGSALFGGGDMNDPEYLQKKLQQLAVGSIGGALANKVIPGVYNKAIGTLAKGARKVLTPELVAKAESLGERLAGRGAGMATKAAGPIGQAITELGPRLAGKVPALAAGAAGTTEALEGAITPEAQEEAKNETNRQYIDIIKDRLERYYTAYFADQMSFDDFVSEVYQKTGGFDPKRTAGILFQNKAEREAYLANYDNILRLQAVKMPGVLEYASKRGNIIGGPSASAQKDYADLINTIAAIESGKGGIPSAAKRKEIDNYIQLIMAQDVPDADKQAMLEDFLESQMGVPLSLYKQAGIYG